MDRAEFLRELEEALAGEVSPATAAENLRYYDAYIAEEAAKGRDEAEVIEEIELKVCPQYLQVYLLFSLPS